MWGKKMTVLKGEDFTIGDIVKKRVGSRRGVVVNRDVKTVKVEWCDYSKFGEDLYYTEDTHPCTLRKV